MLGVTLTTLFASAPKSDPAPTTNVHAYTYPTGIAILSLALLLSGFLGIMQDITYAQYAIVHSATHKHSQNGSFTKTALKDREIPTWQESMFYLHFLALPMFLFLRNDLSAQFNIINSGPVTNFSLPPFLPSILPQPLSLTLPKAYIPLLLNTLTQLLCVAGVHRLTTRVTSLTVTLVLAVRKAASLVISVVWLQTAGPGDLKMMWIGATLVMVGTVGYSVGSTKMIENRIETWNGHGPGGVDVSKAKLD
jgi:UDP-xylose/UDP-N-acetylglucosamine transporter B4